MIVGLSPAVTAAAAVTTLTQLTTIGGGPTLVTYWQYSARDCADEAACRYTGTINTGASGAYKTAVPVVAGFELSVPRRDAIGPIAVRLSGQRGANKPGDVDLQVSAQLRSGSNQLFSYTVTIAVIESFPPEGWRLTASGAACSKGLCPVPINFAAPDGVVPHDYWLVGIALQMFDSDRNAGPLWAAYAVPTDIQRDVATGNLTSMLNCGTATARSLAQADVTGACETKWVAIAARVNTDTQLPLLASLPGIYPGLLTFLTIAGPSPSTGLIQHTCPSSRPIRGYLDALAGFALLTGLNGNPFQPLPGMVSTLSTSASDFKFSPTGLIQTRYGMALTSPQQLIPMLPPLPVPLTAARWSVLACF